MRERTEAYAREIAGLSQTSIRGAKRAVATILNGGSEAFLRALVEAAAIGDDLREGRAAFAQKRKPNFA